MSGPGDRGRFFDARKRPPPDGDRGEAKEGARMKRITLLFAAMAAAIPMTTSGVALAQAQGETFADTVPFETIVKNPCNGETVLISGHLTVLIVSRTNPNNDLFVERVTLQGTGVGGATQAHYAVVGTEMLEQTLHFPGGEFVGGEFTVQRRTQIIGEGKVPDFSARAIAHLTFTVAQGPTAEVFFTDAKCRRSGSR